MPGKVIYIFHWNALEASFCFNVITMLKISISLANFIPVYFNGGQNVVNVFDTRKEWKYIVWKEIRVNNKPIFYRNFFENSIIHVSDLLFNMDTSNSFMIVSGKIRKVNFFTWKEFATSDSIVQFIGRSVE